MKYLVIALMILGLAGYITVIGSIVKQLNSGKIEQTIKGGGHK